jgi:hypothetical protein
VADALVLHLAAELPESLLPRARVQIDGIHERPVDVEDDGFDQRPLPPKFVGITYNNSARRVASES